MAQGIQELQVKLALQRIIRLSDKRVCLQELLNISTHPFLDAARLAQGPLGSRDTVSDTAVAFAEAPELSTHFLGKKASWSGVIVSASR